MTEQDEILVVGVAGLTETVRALSSRVDVAGNLADRQARLDRLTGRLWKAIAVLAVCFVVLVGSAYQSRSTLADQQSAKTRVVCEALNASNAKNAEFWHNLFEKFPLIVPGPDATESEKNTYRQSVARTAALVIEIDKLGVPAQC